MSFERSAALLFLGITQIITELAGPVVFRGRLMAFKKGTSGEA